MEEENKKQELLDKALDLLKSTLALAEEKKKELKEREEGKDKEVVAA